MRTTYLLDCGVNQCATYIPQVGFLGQNRGEGLGDVHEETTHQLDSVSKDPAGGESSQAR